MADSWGLLHICTFINDLLQSRRSIIVKGLPVYSEWKKKVESVFDDNCVQKQLVLALSFKSCLRHNSVSMLLG